MKVKLTITLLLAIFVTLTACNRKSQPPLTGEQTWQLANNITATLTSGMLTISGSGALIGEGEYSEGEGYFPYVYPWSEYSGEITNVIIENGITEIGDLAFQNKQLTSVTIPNSVTKIGDSAFSSNQLAEVTLPNSVTVIKVSAFYGNPLTSITIGANVYIGFEDDDGQPDAAFSDDFVNYYNSGGKKAGTYTLNKGVWSLPGSVATTGYKIGDRGPAGGIVFYDKGKVTDGWRYLEAAPEAYRLDGPWGFDGQPVIETETGIGSGRKNTDILVSMSTSKMTESAAYKCSQLEINGFKDWFLPSKDELDLMYRNLYLQNKGSFDNGAYWSSSVWDEEGDSEYNLKNLTWIQEFEDGTQRANDYFNYRGNNISIRAIRAFSDTNSKKVAMPSQSYVGLWQTGTYPPDELTILEIDNDSIKFGLGIHRTIGTSGTATLENDKYVFVTDTDAVCSGTIQFNQNSISLTVEKSEHPYILAGTTWDFIVKSTIFFESEYMWRFGDILAQWNQAKLTISGTGAIKEAYPWTGEYLDVFDLIIEDGITEIGEGAFIGKQMQNITIPNSVTSIGTGAFSFNKLTSITIGANVDLGSKAFDGNFNNTYNNNGKRGGTYTLKKGFWLFDGFPMSTGNTPPIGSLINFGSREWRVLEVKDGQALIISEQIIEQRPYHTSEDGATWENCNLRGYLNGDYYKDVFSKEEKARIMETRNSNPKNPLHDTAGSTETIDKIFLLSLDEVLKYFCESDDLKKKREKIDWAKVTFTYTEDQNIYDFVAHETGEGVYLHDKYDETRIANNAEGKRMSWWLRTPGVSPQQAMDVRTDGQLSFDGAFGYYDGYAEYAFFGVRPVMWVKL